MNPLRIFNQVISDFKTRIRKKFAKTLGIKDIGAYKKEIQEMLDDLESVAQPEVIEELVEQYGIQGAAQHYIELNKYYREYYFFIIKEVKKAENTTNEFKNFARRAEAEWESTYKEIIQYLYDKKQRMLYGDTNEDVKTYKANSFADQPLPWLRKEELNEEDIFNSDYIPEGLFGASVGVAGGAAVAVAISSLSAAFHIHPKVFTGISTAVGALIGHFIQKHYFIDFTNYVKLKRYITHYPESFEVICDLMAKNAVKFQQKDPVKYKKILMNLKRLQQNPPEIYKNYLDDEIEAEESNLDSGLFDVKDREGNLIKSGTSQIVNNNYYNRDSRISRRDRFSSRRALSRRRDYDMDDLTNNKSISHDQLAIQTKDLLGDL